MSKKRDFSEKAKDLIEGMMGKEFDEDLFREKFRELVSNIIKE